ncbi:hypothetical protein JMJ77_0011576 [Colletotrichum scovillei]|uniref:Uncharacterized protein n=1 Tax=Colletotrichum scovillei TaxID=1209932 RepID=A0A9P7QW67_9PEZI|nr:hypothetical protein JMJ77_0011576 [Colletotrichum scovillei]KAG7045858.1 hypothetical protein JMJ78_0010929 [Colletotrichum scovillei]KAG7063202.1 hypothetical protein JMJ76_0005670 [Colletotrichum scovillei]
MGPWLDGMFHDDAVTSLFIFKSTTDFNQVPTSQGVGSPSPPSRTSKLGV